MFKWIWYNHFQWKHPTFHFQMCETHFWIHFVVYMFMLFISIHWNRIEKWNIKLKDFSDNVSTNEKVLFFLRHQPIHVQIYFLMHWSIDKTIIIIFFLDAKFLLIGSWVKGHILMWIMFSWKFSFAHHLSWNLRFKCF
jgi:hypothetical protein